MQHVKTFTSDLSHRIAELVRLSVSINNLNKVGASVRIHTSQGQVSIDVMAPPDTAWATSDVIDIQPSEGNTQERILDMIDRVTKSLRAVFRDTLRGSAV